MGQAKYNQLHPEEKQKKLEAIGQLLKCFLDTIKEAGTAGAPSGPMYLAAMSMMTLEQYEAIMKALRDGGYVTLKGNVYFWVKDLP